MTYTLYYSPSAASMSVHWMLVELGIDFNAISIDIDAGSQHSPDYLALNPEGRVPTLIFEGRPYTESAALLMLLAERHPEAGFAPAPGSPGRAEYLELMVYLANNMLPAFRAWFYPEELANAEHQADVRDHIQKRIEHIFARLDARLADGRDYLLGARISAVDFLAGLMARWSRDMPRPAATSWPHLGAYVQRLRAREALREVHRREGLTDWIAD